jgi:Heterokaryon incompatibility protein (HET)
MGKIRTGSRRHYEGLASPSSSIRLLTFNPLHKTRLFDYTLKSYDLDSCPPYVALSYEWGEFEPQVEVMINGVPSLIRHNLSLFLSVLQAKMKQAKLERKTLSHDVCPWVDAMWIDAICIDQEDLFERNAQVSIMGQIYQRAALVFAWLGWPQGWDPKLTFEFIGRHFKDWSVQSDSKMLQMVVQMCRCRYWSRRWIVQEILLARDVTIMCGENDLSWSDLRRFSLRYLRSPVQYEFDSLKGLDKTIPFIMSRHTGVFTNEVQKVSTIRELLVDFSGTDCEVFHDKVYSLLSLASDGDNIAVDYGCLPHELFYRALSRDSGSYGDLQLLAEDFGIPTPLLKVSEPAALTIENKFPVTHQIHLCSTPLSLPKREWRFWRARVEESLTKPCQELTGLPDFFKIVCPFKPCRPSRHCYYYDCGEENFPRESPELFREFDNQSGRLVFCSDGTVGLAFGNVRAGDLLCDFTPGRKLIIREDHKNPPSLVGTATLLGAFPAFADLMHPVQQASYPGLRRQRNIDFPLLVSSTDGSTGADGLSKVETCHISDRILALTNFVSLAKAYQLSLPRHKRTLPKQTIKGSFNMWDLIALATWESRFFSAEELDDQLQAALSVKRNKPNVALVWLAYVLDRISSIPKRVN